MSKAIHHPDATFAAPIKAQTERDAPQFAQIVEPTLPSAGAKDDESEPSTSDGSAEGQSGGAFSVTPSLPGLPGATNTPSIPSASAPSSTAAGAAASGELNIIIRNPDNIQLPSGSSQIELVLRNDQSQSANNDVDGGGLGFIEILTALILALIIAPFLQKEAGKFTKSLNAFAFIKKNGLVISAYLIAFTFGWIVFLIILPQLYMFDFSFRYNLPPSEIGGANDVYTLKNYRYMMFGREGSPELLNWLHIGVFVKTIVASVFVTLLNFMLCYPLAYYMAQSVSGRSQRLLFLCLLLPFWINEILRAFAFKLIFADLGLINNALIGLGLWDTPFDFLRADVALYTGLTYAYMLLMIFPLYNAIESLDHNQVEAARDMGASWLRIHLRIVMPYAKPGIASGCTMVFMLTAGALAAPNILGGPSSLWFTQIIYQWYNTGGNWPQGSAYSFVLLIICIVFVMTMMRVAKVSLGDLAKR